MMLSFFRKELLHTGTKADERPHLKDFLSNLLERVTFVSHAPSRIN